MLEKLTKPKTEPSIKMDPPRPPADIPDPPSTSRIRPKAGVGDGWMKRRADGQYNPSYADVPSKDAAKKQGDEPAKGETADLTNHDHVVTLIIATIATPFYGFKLRKFLLPVAKHVRLYATQLRHFANSEIPLSRNDG